MSPASQRKGGLDTQPNGRGSSYARGACARPRGCSSAPPTPKRRPRRRCLGLGASAINASSRARPSLGWPRSLAARPCAWWPASSVARSWWTRSSRRSEPTSGDTSSTIRRCMACGWTRCSRPFNHAIGPWSCCTTTAISRKYNWLGRWVCPNQRLECGCTGFGCA
jgi:hypothetical protein